jgi:hypothetical protein
MMHPNGVSNCSTKALATIVNKYGRKIESLRPEDVGVRYHLPEPICSLNETFLKGFHQK